MLRKKKPIRQLKLARPIKSPTLRAFLVRDWNRQLPIIEKNIFTQLKKYVESLQQDYPYSTTGRRGGDDQENYSRQFQLAYSFLLSAILARVASPRLRPTYTALFLDPKFHTVLDLPETRQLIGTPTMKRLEMLTDQFNKRVHATPNMYHALQDPAVHTLYHAVSNVHSRVWLLLHRRRKK